MLVQVHVFRCAGYFGIGFTPKQAVNAAVEEGCNRRDVPKGSMIRLPVGVTEVDVDAYGSVGWKGPDALSEKLTWDKSERNFK